MSDLVDRAAIQEMSGAAKRTVNAWVKRDSFPTPVGDRLWRRSDVQFWLVTQRPSRGHPNNRNNAYPPEVIAALRQRARENRNVHDLAREFDMSRTTIYQHTRDILRTQAEPKQFRGKPKQ